MPTAQGRQTALNAAPSVRSHVVGDPLGVATGFAARRKVAQHLQRAVVEVARRRCGMRLSLAAQEAADIAEIFAHQGVGGVFRMPLEEQRRAPGRA